MDVVAGRGPAGRTAGHSVVAVQSLAAFEAAAENPQRNAAVAGRRAVRLTVAAQSLVDLAAGLGSGVVAGRKTAPHTVGHSAAGLVAACPAGTCRSDPACSYGVPDSAKLPSILVQVSGVYSFLSGPAKASVGLCQVLAVLQIAAGLVRGHAVALPLSFLVEGTAILVVMLGLGAVAKVSSGLVEGPAVMKSTFVESVDLLADLILEPVLGTLLMVADGDDVLVLVDLATFVAGVAVVLVRLLAMVVDGDDGDDGDDVLLRVDLAIFLAAVAVVLVEFLAMVVGGAVDLVARSLAIFLAGMVVVLDELLAMVVEVAVPLALVEIVDSVVVRVLVTAVSGDNWAASFGDDRGGQ